MDTDRIKLPESWKAELAPEFEKPYMKELKSFLLKEYAAGKKIFPPKNEIFQALNLTPLPDVKVVILGQDPYHGPGQAHGLSFSVKKGIAIPPSLRNIFLELKRAYNLQGFPSGDLTHWAKQGVLLLNAVLTVQESQANSHQGKGWELFTDKIIQVINDKREGVAFLLWGSYAQKKAHFIDTTKHLVLKSPHPSPLSAHRGFLGNGHFDQANTYLKGHGGQPINWSLE